MIKILFPEEPIPIKSSQFSELPFTQTKIFSRASTELKINNKIIEELDIKKELSITYFKLLIDNDRNIWIIGTES